MSQLTQSPFLQALGYTIINSLWQFALLWLIYVSIHAFLKLSSHQKYAAGIVIQAAGFSWFAATFTFYLNKFAELQEIHFQQKNLNFAFSDTSSSTINNRLFAVIIQTESLLPYLSVAYLLILFLLSVKWIRAYKLTEEIKTNGLQKIPVNWRLFVKQLSAQLGIKREVRIYLSDKVNTPLTIGSLKPFILIPLASLNHLTTHQMEAVILHELAHIKRYDYLFNLFLAVIEITLFFNPFMHLINRHIKRERENCCDDWVLQYEYNPESYASALLQIATCQAPSLLALQAADNKKVLLNRIIRMIEKKEINFFNYRYQIVALFVMLTVLSSLALLSSSHNIKTAVATSSRQVIVEPMAEIVNNPLLNPDFFIAPADEKVIKANNLLAAKIKNSDFRFGGAVTGNTTVTGYDAKQKQKHTHKTLQAAPQSPPVLPNNPPEPAVPEKQTAEELVKNVETPNTAFEIALSDDMEQQNAEIQQQLKQLTLNLLDKNVSTTDQKALIAEIKDAFNQLQNTRISWSRKQEKSVRKEIRNNLRENEWQITSRFTPCELNKLTEEMQLKTDEIRKQTIKAVEMTSQFRNVMPKMIYVAPFTEKPHNFSFEFSTEPGIKVAPIIDFDNHKKTKKVNKKLENSNNNNDNFNFPTPSPFNLEKPATKPRRECRDVLVIRI